MPNREFSLPSCAYISRIMNIFICFQCIHTVLQVVLWSPIAPSSQFHTSRHWLVWIQCTALLSTLLYLGTIGTFLVRESETKLGDYTLVVVFACIGTAFLMLT